MKLILGAYSQLPYGSPKEDYDLLLTRSIQPLLTMLYQNPENKAVLRLGINIFEFLEENHPEINMLINDLTRKNQLELLTSSYYDTVISLVPSQERFNQVEKTTTYLRKHFSKKPSGLWLYHQVFNPTIVPAMSLSDLNYIIISGYNQLTSQVVSSKPFYMDEMGKFTIVFPSDDQFSKEIYEFSKTNENDEKLLSSISKLVQSPSTSFNTIMLNMDQVSKSEKASSVYKIIFDAYGNNSVLPSEYLKDHEITKNAYLPNGIYGRDFSVGKANSFNQLIIDNPLQLRNLCLLSSLREVIKDVKKNTDERKYLESLIIKAGCSSLYIPEYSVDPEIRRVSNRCLCEIESILLDTDNLMTTCDIDGDRIAEEVIANKACICYLNTKGAVLSRLNITSSLYDLVFHNGNGLFSDVLRNSVTSKVTDLSSRRYEITSLDKKRQDFFAKCPTFEIEKVPINFTKRFKLRQNAIIVEIGIENIGNNVLKDYQYESCLNLSLPVVNALVSVNNEKVESEEFDCNSFVISSKQMPFTISVFVNENITCNRKVFTQKTDNLICDRVCYQYDQFRLQKKFTVNPNEEINITIAMKIDKNTRR